MAHVQILFPFIGNADFQKGVIRCLQYAVNDAIDEDREEQAKRRKGHRGKTLVYYFEEEGQIIQDTQSEFQLLFVLVSIGAELRLNFSLGSEEVLKSVVSLDTLVRVCLPYSKDLVSQFGDWLKQFLSQKFDEKPLDDATLCTMGILVELIGELLGTLTCK